MRVVIGSEGAELRDQDLVGTGGEARVFAWRGRAVKIYHPPEDAAARARVALALRKVKAFPRGLPEEVIAPQEIVRDRAGEEIGFVMPLLASAFEAGRMAQKKWRDGRMGAGEVLAIFDRLAGALKKLHARGIAVGDLNDGNVLVAGDRPRLIDADSMQVEGLPCTVAHERFLDPRLYNVDLSGAPRFSAETDWYALAVMLFASLLYVHPYGGTHASYPTMLRRAEAGVSVLRSEVTYPRAAIPFGVLPDGLLHWFEGTFEKGRREPLPGGTWRFTRCACGVEHARASCPACAKPTLVPRASGRCRAVALRREHLQVPAPRYALEGDWVIDVARGTRAGQVLGGQTWMSSGPSMAIGVYRVGLMRRGFVVTSRGKFDFELPAARERPVDAAGYFDGERALLVLASDRHGKRVHEMFLVDARGEVLAQAIGEDEPMLSLSGKCMAHGAIIQATDRGLLLIRVDASARAFVPDRVFTETEPFVWAGADLVAGPQGSVLVVGDREITELSLG